MQRSIDYRTHLIGLLVALGAVMYLMNAPAIRDVDNATAKQLVEAGAVVIDVRSRDAYAAGHIAGARSVPLSSLQDAIPKDLDKTKPIVVYCGDGVSTGPKATRIMNGAGFEGAVNLKHGIEGWRKEGLPTATGKP